MKCLCLAGILFFALCTAVCAADESCMKETAVVSAADGKACGGGLKEIDVGSAETPNSALDAKMSGPSGRIYDSNTGMPDVVESDRAGEIE